MSSFCETIAVTTNPVEHGLIWLLERYIKVSQDNLTVAL